MRFSIFKITNMILHSFKRDISNLIWRAKWIKQTSNIARIIKAQVLNISHQSTLILAPHADDELIGCYSVIISALQQKKGGGIVLMNYSYNDSNRDTRIIEFTNFLEKSALTDNIVYLDHKQRIDSLFDVIDRARPQQIYLPCFIDWHPDHRDSNIVLAKCLRQIPKYNPTILWYQVSIPLPAKMINAFAPMTKSEYKQKWKDFSFYYPSQANLPKYRFIQVESVNSKAAGYKYGECFISMTSTKFQSAINLLSDKISQINNLKRYINHLDKSLAEVDKLVIDNWQDLK